MFSFTYQLHLQPRDRGKRPVSRVRLGLGNTNNEAYKTCFSISFI